MSQLDFKPKVREQSFTRAVGNDLWIVHLAFVRHPHDFDVTVDLGVRIDKVAQLLNQVGYSPRDTVTVGAELGNIVDGRPRRWTVGQPTDIPPVVRDIVKEVTSFGIPWFERQMRLDELLTTLRENDRASWLLSPVHVKRNLTALALAALSRRPEEVERVMEGAKRFLSSQKGAQLSEFNASAGRLMELNR